MNNKGYSKEKHMARSILPSRAAKEAKSDKDKLHRKNRRTSTLQCNKLKGYEEDVLEDYDDTTEDLTYWWENHRSPGYEDIVYNRRGADNLNHFIAWSWLKTKDMRQCDKMSYLRSVMPMGLIGYHAMSHLESYLEYDPLREEEDDWWSIPHRFRNTPYKKHNHWWIQRESVSQIQRDEVWAFFEKAKTNRETRDLLNHLIYMAYEKEVAAASVSYNKRGVDGKLIFVSRHELKKEYIEKNPRIEFTTGSDIKPFFDKYFWKIYYHFHPEEENK